MALIFLFLFPSFPPHSSPLTSSFYLALPLSRCVSFFLQHLTEAGNVNTAETVKLDPLLWGDHRDNDDSCDNKRNSHFEHLRYAGHFF